MFLYKIVACLDISKLIKFIFENEFLGIQIIVIDLVRSYWIFLKIAGYK